MTHAISYRSASGAALGLLLVASLAGSAHAQSTPLPPAPTRDTVALLRPATIPLPPRPSGIRASQLPATRSAVVPMTSSAPLPASRPQAAVAVATPPSLNATSVAPAHLPPKHPSVTATVNRPAGATAHCKDGTYLTGGAPEAGCSTHGGVGAVLPSARVTPAAPVRRP